MRVMEARQWNILINTHHHHTLSLTLLIHYNDSNNTFVALNSL